MEVNHHVARPRIFEHAECVGTDVRGVPQTSRSRGLEQHIVRHGVPQRIGQLGSHLVVREEDPTIRQGLGALFDPVQEVRRLQEGGEHHLHTVCEVVSGSHQGRARLEQRAIGVQLVRRERSPEGPLSKGADPVSGLLGTRLARPHGLALPRHRNPVHVQVSIRLALDPVVVQEGHIDGVGAPDEIHHRLEDLTRSVRCACDLGHQQLLTIHPQCHLSELVSRLIRPGPRRHRVGTRLGDIDDPAELSVGPEVPAVPVHRPRAGIHL